jgi:hypothetical protein
MTSYEAAESIKDKAPDHWSEIIECLAKHGALGKTEYPTKQG